MYFYCAYMCTCIIIIIILLVELTDKDGSLLDVRDIKFRTDEGCIYCPAGVCSCDVSIICYMYITCTCTLFILL